MKPASVFVRPPPELRSFLAGLESEPGRVEHVEGELDRIAAAKRRYGCASYEELLARGGEARVELDAREAGADPAAEPEAALQQAQAKVDELAAALRKARRAAAKPFAKSVATELHGIGLGDGEFHVELGEREPSPAGIDTVAFLIRPNAGLPFAPVAETASGGELSRIALAIAAAAGGKMTLVFDEIDAGHRRPDGPRRRPDAATARRALAGRHDHPSAADRQRRRSPLQRRESRRRSHPHRHRGAGRGRTARGARTHARRPRVSLDRSMSFPQCRLVVYDLLGEDDGG